MKIAFFLVAEPTRKEIAFYRQWIEYAADYDVALKAIGNKVHEPEDVAFLREHVGDALLCCGESGEVVTAAGPSRRFSGMAGPTARSRRGSKEALAR